jgi:hypothetical protein
VHCISSLWESERLTHSRQFMELYAFTLIPPATVFFGRDSMQQKDIAFFSAIIRGEGRGVPSASREFKPPRPHQL